MTRKGQFLRYDCRRDNLHAPVMLSFAGQVPTNEIKDVRHRVPHIKPKFMLCKFGVIGSKYCLFRTGGKTLCEILQNFNRGLCIITLKSLRHL